MKNNFGKNLAIIQTLRGISNEALAKKLNITPCSITNHRKSRNNPSLRTICNYAKALGVRPGLLIDDVLIEKIGKELENG